MAPDAEHSELEAWDMKSLHPLKHWVEGSNPIRDMDVCRIYSVFVLSCA
jgi:hypothetical protein